MRRFRFLTGIGLALLALVLLLPVGSAAPVWTTASTGLGPIVPAASTAVTLQVNQSAIDLAPTFWGTTVSARAPLFANETALVTATPARVVLWPGANAGDDYDPLNNTLWANNNSYTTPVTNESQFVTWCRSVQCSAIFEVSGVIDNATVAEEEVYYTEVTLGFHPTYWEIGNEPGFWAHWGQMWGQWTSYTTGPTPTQYADEVEQYVAAMRQVDPHLQLIGLPGVGRVHDSSVADWIDAMIDVDGPNLSAVAVHIYPDLSGSQNTLAQFYGTLNGTLNNQAIPGRVPGILKDIQNAIASSPACATFGCASIPLFFTEIGSAISGRPDATEYSTGFAGGLYIAAEFTQAIAVGGSVLNVDAYATVLSTVNSWFTPSGDPRPEYSVYSDFASHLGSVAHTVAVTSSASTIAGNVYATSTIDPTDGNRSDLLVVNTNVATNVSFAPSLPGYSLGAPVEAWTWNSTTVQDEYGPNVAPATVGPVAQFYPGGLPTNFTLQNQSLVLFEAYPTHGAPVTLTETGLPNGTRWWIGVGNHNGTSSTSNVTLFLPTGSYTTSPGPAVGVPYHLRTERWDPAGPTAFTLPASGAAIGIPYSLQYAVNVSVRPNGAGMTTPGPGWADANAEVTLTASPGAGFAFAQWYGWGSGSVNSSMNPVTIQAVDPLHETAIFVPAYAVEFEESGLPAATPWSVVVRGSTFSGTGTEIVAAEGNGTFGFQVAPVPGFAPHPASSSVTVGGGPVTVDIRFSADPFYSAVTFTESGLPSAANWSVTIRNLTLSSAGTTVSFAELNGTYTYSLALESGLRASPPRGGFTATGTPLTIHITWISTTPVPKELYAVVFQVTDPLSASLWTVAVGDTVARSLGATATVNVSNGTWHYSVSAPSGYKATPGGGTITVSGGSVSLDLSFNLTLAKDPRHTVAAVDPPALPALVLEGAEVATMIAVSGMLTYAVVARRPRSDPEAPPEPDPILPAWSETPSGAGANVDFFEGPPAGGPAGALSGVRVAGPAGPH